MLKLYKFTKCSEYSKATGEIIKNIDINSVVFHTSYNLSIDTSVQCSHIRILNIMLNIKRERERFYQWIIEKGNTIGLYLCVVNDLPLLTLLIVAYNLNHSSFGSESGTTYYHHVIKKQRAMENSKCIRGDSARESCQW